LSHSAVILKEVNMRKGLLAISLVLLLTLAFVAPSCNPTTGTINVKATLDGVPWTGAVSYNLTPASGTGTSGASVDKSFTVEAGTWTCAYVSGGPGAFVNITPSATQTLAVGGNITFTLNFQTVGPTQVDAHLEFVGWTINGTQIGPQPPAIIWVGKGTWIDAEYTEHVEGQAVGTVVPVHQTSWLKVHNTGEEGGGVGMPITLHVVNAPGAVTLNPPVNPENQTCTKDGAPVAVCDLIQLPVCETITLDVEVDWELKICTTYTKTINWIGYPSPPPILFDATIVPPFHTITLVSYACIEVGEGFEDTNPDNDCCANSPMITIGFLP
jgi:hypothetical protein